MRRTRQQAAAALLACALLLAAGQAAAQAVLADALAGSLGTLVDHGAAQPMALPLSTSDSRSNPGSVRLRFGRHTLLYSAGGRSGEPQGEAFVIGSRRVPVRALTEGLAPMDAQSITATAFRIGSRKYVALQGSATDQRRVSVHLFAVHRTALSFDPPVSFANLHLGARAIGRLPDGRLGVALIEASPEAGATRYAATPMAIVTTRRALVPAGEHREIGRVGDNGAFAASRHQ